MEDIFWSVLLSWYKSNQRYYPWRDTDNVFHILIAEMFLQQTRADQALGVYRDVINIYPTPEMMSKACEVELLEMIKPIGLAYRAARLIQSSNLICKKYDSIVPKSRTELLELPGIGDYIADAVLCYGYGIRTIPIDTNVCRLFMRYFGLEAQSERVRLDMKLKASIREKYIFKCTREPNLAVLDYADAICKARNPECSSCELAHYCCSSM